MRCPYCKVDNDKVIDSRTTSEGLAIRRRRECLGCSRRFTTYETVEEAPIRVVKKDGMRQEFDRKKILQGLKKACEKRPVSTEALDKVVAEIEIRIVEEFDREVSTKFIGEMAMEKLRTLDQVAYVRFASVYREFSDIRAFVTELEGIQKPKT